MNNMKCTWQLMPQPVLIAVYCHSNCTYLNYKFDFIIETLKFERESFNLMTESIVLLYFYPRENPGYITLSVIN